jgi:hypothetical protein
MKIRLILLISFICSSIINGQAVSYDDFNSVIPFLKKENFKGAFEKTNQLLNSTINDSSDLRGIITYMNIFSAAGMVTLNQMTMNDFSTNVTKYIGQRIVMSGHPCVDSTKRGFNSLTFLREEGQLQGFTMAANKAATSILCFEYFKYEIPINPSDFIGKDVRCGGTLESFEVGTGPLKTWISRLHISKAFISPSKSLK